MPNTGRRRVTQIQHKLGRPNIKITQKKGPGIVLVGLEEEEKLKKDPKPGGSSWSTLRLAVGMGDH